MGMSLQAVDSVSHWAARTSNDADYVGDQNPDLGGGPGLGFCRWGEVMWAELRGEGGGGSRLRAGGLAGAATGWICLKVSDARKIR